MKIQKAKSLLKNVKSEQFVSKDRFNERHFGFGEYRCISKILKSTEKALFISEPKCQSNPNEGFWIPKSKVLFFLNSKSDESVSITMKFENKYTNVFKENIKSSNKDSNSVWCDIFKKQDQNGLTVNGYSLD